MPIQNVLDRDDIVSEKRGRSPAADHQAITNPDTHRKEEPSARMLRFVGGIVQTRCTVGRATFGAVGTGVGKAGRTVPVEVEPAEASWKLLIAARRSADRFVFFMIP
jgi:hypothetical protein